MLQLSLILVQAGFHNIIPFSCCLLFLPALVVCDQPCLTRQDLSASQSVGLWDGVFFGCV
jgi:hypothetical protein